MTNSSQTVTGTATYEGFGQTVATTGSSSDPYMFAATSGYRNDGDAGLMHVGARYYDAQVGRFITRDTLLDQHPYLYCNHNPVNSLDPDGHMAEEAVAEWAGSVKGLIGGGAVVGAVGGAIEDNTPPHTFWHGVGGTAAGVGTTFVGIGLVAAGAVATAPVVIVGATIVGTGLAVWGVVHAVKSWLE